MPAKSSLCFAIPFLCVALIASPAAAEKKHKSHGHGHGHRGTYSRVSLSPFGINIGVAGDHFGFDWTAPFAAAPLYGDVPPVAFGSANYGVVEPFYVAPTLPPAVAVVPNQPLSPPWPAAGHPARTTIPTNYSAAPFQAEAERAFHAGRFDLALSAVRHAIAEDGQNGKLILFESHVHMALGDYTAAAETLGRGLQRLPQHEWAFVVQQYEQLYQGQAYVHQMRALEAFLVDHPRDTAAHVVRGYHYLFLGQRAAGQQALEQALALDPGNRLGTALLQVAHRIARPAAPAPIEQLPTPATPLEHAEQE